MSNSKRELSGQGMRHGQGQRRGPRAASVFACVLVVLLLVGMLCIQTTQSLLIIRRSDVQRAKLYQAREVLELAQEIEWGQIEATNFAISIPQTIPVSGEPELFKAKVEIKLSEQVSQDVERIVIYYPSEKPGEVTASWELRK